jgi:hypothetical protein
MAEPLEAVKNRLSEQYLGKAGIHGIGVSHADRAIRVYLHEPGHPDRDRVLQQIREHAAPYIVRVIDEQAPSATA